jgi:cytochrome bd-type quinol oxidase subunit 2
MNYTSLFYWLTVADNARTLFIWGIVLFTILSVIAIASLFIMGVDEEDLNSDTRVLARKWAWRSVPFMFLFWSLFIFTPSKKDALLIVAGGQTMNFLTTDKSAKQIPHELSAFVVTELKNMAADAKVDLNIKDKKEKILDEAKNMSAKELVEKMKVDTTFAKIVLDK